MAEKPKRIKDQVGEVYGNWKVIEFHSMSETSPSGKTRSKWVVENIKTGEYCVKSIQTLYNLRYAKKYPERMGKWRKKWVAEHRTEWNARTLENYYKNREHRKVVMKAYYEKNKERLRAYGREYMHNRDKAKIKESTEKLKARRDNNAVLEGQTNKTPQTYLGRVFNARYAYQKSDAPVSKWCDIEFRRAYARGESYRVSDKSVTVIDKIRNWLKKK